MLMMVLLASFLSILLIVINTLISMKTNMDREKPSPFECGFDPKSSARLPFSLRFYLIAVVFLIFDVEITLIMPIPLLIQFSSVFSLLMISLFFIFILLIGLYLEWVNGALEWA